jgi:hypothetical protein
LRCSGCCTGFYGGNWKCEGRNASFVFPSEVEGFLGLRSG